MAISDSGLRKRVRFFNNREQAVRDARSRSGVVIQYIRGRQWATATGAATIRESLKRARESLAYLGKSPPKIVADFHKKKAG